MMGEAQFPVFTPVCTFKMGDHAQNSISALKFSPNGEFLAGVSDEIVSVWKISGSSRSPIIERKSSNGKLNDVVWSSDGTKLIAAACNGNVVLYDLQTINAESVVGSHKENAFSCHMKPMSNVIATGGGDGYVRQWDIRGGQVILSQNLVDTKLVTTVQYNINGSSLVCGGYDGFMFHFNTSAMRASNPEPPRVDPDTTSAISSMEFIPDSEEIVVSRVDGSIKLWDLDQPRVIKKLTGNRGIFSADDGYLFKAHYVATNWDKYIISGSPTSRVYIWNLNRPGSPSNFWAHLESASGNRGNSTEVIVATDVSKPYGNIFRVASTSVGGKYIHVHQS